MLAIFNPAMIAALSLVIVGEAFLISLILISNNAADLFNKSTSLSLHLILYSRLLIITEILSVDLEKAVEIKEAS